MNNKSISRNIVLNVIRTTMGMVFPLITYPYICRVLGVENLGKINFSLSVIGYFSLLANFGVATYAVRECAKVRDDRAAVEKVGCEIFTINLWMTVVSLALLLAVTLVTPSLRPYRLLLLLQSTSILFATAGVEWLNTVYEDYTYITIRTLVFNIISMILLFVLVHRESDVYVYVGISVVTSLGISLCNYIYCRRYFWVRAVRKCNVSKHIRPMFTLFCSNLTTTIFVNSDQTILGLLCGDYYVGLYAVAVKIYSIIKSVFSAILIVLVPRVTNLQHVSDEQTARAFRTQAFDLFMLFLIPLTAGTFCMGDYAVFIIAGAEFLPAVTSLRILTGALLCSGLASFMTYLIVVPCGYDRVLLMSSSISAAINIVLNLILIPHLKHNAAAFTTLVAEGMVFLLEWYAVRDRIDLKKSLPCVFQACAGCLAIPLSHFLALQFTGNALLIVVITVVLSVVFYIIILLLLKNSYICMFRKLVEDKLRARRSANHGS